VVFYDKDNSSLATNWLADIKTFDRQTLFIATGWGLFTINTENGHIAPLQDNEGKAFLEKQLIRILYPAPDGWLWIGTATGLYAWHKEHQTIHHLTTEDGLGDNLVKAIGQDLHGNIWVTGDHSVTRIAVQKDGQDISIEDCQALSPGNGIGDGTFHVRAIARLTDGRMVFGHSKGCLTINPRDIPVGTSLVWWPWAVNIGVLSVLILLAMAAWRKRKNMKHAPIEPSTLEITSVDEQLKEKAIRIVEEHISNSEFSVEQLSEALGMSRGHLYKRLTAITGKTPIEFIRTIRIKRGRQLLEESGDGVQQVAWRIGMSPKQFAKYFKEEYGVLPSDFIRNKP
jgi:AraC-like DNA-binding protein